jgi:glycine/D-amino acid oxidase-like deaminating enzyme
VRADVIINAAGPFAAHVSALHGESLPIINVLQQKIAFPDQQGVIPRQMPFSIDLDGQSIEWTAEERESLAADPNLARFLDPMPGNIHCRPDGGERGTWIKLGWAYNSTPSAPVLEPALDPNFPEIVVRGASRLHPRLKPYITAMPRERVHYGGYYPMTAENWPLIGPAKTPGVFLITALSGYGTMAACAAGDMCALWVAGAAPSTLAKQMSFARYEDQNLMAGAAGTAHRGHL